MRPGMHTSCSGWPQCFKFGKKLVRLESMTLQIEDFIPPDHTRANYAGLVLHGAHR